MHRMFSLLVACVTFGLVGCSASNKELKVESVPFNESPIHSLAMCNGYRAVDMRVSFPMDAKRLVLTWQFKQSKAYTVPNIVCEQTVEINKKMREKGVVQVVGAIDDSSDRRPAEARREHYVYIYCHGKFLTGRLSLPRPAMICSMADIGGGYVDANQDFVMDEILFSIPDASGSTYVFDPKTRMHTVRTADWKLRFCVKFQR